MTDDPGCVCLDCNARLRELKPCPHCGSHRVDLYMEPYPGEPRHSYYNRQGEPMTLLEYAEIADRDDYKRIAQTEVGGMVLVSTIWLGINHRLSSGPPLIFETMAFVQPRDDDPPHPHFGRPLITDLDEFIPTRRYSSEDEAQLGHLEVVAEAEAWLARQRAWIEVAVADIEGEQE